jgi:hypothetical protein
MLEVLVQPSPHPRHVGGVRPVESSVPHIAVGLWAATILVLVLPSPGPTRHRVRESDLLRAHSVAMTTFALL